MAEDPQQKAGVFHPAVSSRNQRGPEDNHEACFQQSITSQVSKEKLYEQRQKCELKRLLKHTHPELKVDDVEEELAEVLSSDTAWATGETGYEGEVYSRCLIFENRVFSDTSPKQTAVRSDNSTILTVESVEDDALVSNAGSEEELKSIDVQAARRIFEIQSGNTSRLNPAKLRRNVPLSGNEAKQGNKNNTLLNRDTNNGGTRSPPHPQSTDQELSGMEANHSGETVTEDETSLHDAETSGDTIKTSAALYKNNPFISKNIERERSFVHTSNPQCAAGDSRDAPACLQANVKERAYLFESLPFDKIRNQNKDEIETMVENIRETLSSLYHANAIHSHGSIIEVNETMKAKKAHFTILDGRPVVQYDEVTEGGAQNFILQLIPRVNLKPQITYLKEDNRGSVTATVVNVQFHQHRFNSDHDTEFKTTHLVQVVEDILNQDNSLRKGVIIQEDMGASADVIVYSLYNYFDEGNVKSYCPPQRTGYDELQPGGSDMSKTSNQELTERGGESTIKSHLDTPKDPNCTGPMKPEIKVKGHVKLFTSCIEKGDFECLRSFQAESIVQDQELERPITEDVAGQGVELQQDSGSNQTERSEWIPVDVKQLKNIFSGDQNQCEALAQSTTSAGTSPSGPLRKNQSCAESNTSVFFQQQLKDNFRPQKPENTCVHLETQDNERARKAELVEVVDDNDEISNLKIAINTLQKVTLEAKTLQERQKSLVQEPSKNPFVVVAMGDVKQIEIETPQGNVGNKADPSKKPRSQEFLSNTDIPCECKLDLHHKTTEDCQKETAETCTEMGQNSNSASVHGSEMVAAQLEGEEVFQGTLQAALKSLERSNINVTRGDFKAAMIYRNSSKSHKVRSPNVDVFAQEPTKEDICPFPLLKSSQANQREEASKAKADLSCQSKPLNKAATGVERNKKHTKPAIPPKPEHLKGKQRDIQSTDTKNPKNKIPKEKVHCYEMPEPNSVTFQTKEDAVVPMCQEAEMSQVQGSIITVESDKTDESVSNQQQESHNLESAKPVSVKNVPVKPKRVKSAQLENKNPNSPILSEAIPILHGSSHHNPNTNENADSNEKNNKTMTQESKVEMREKKGRTETDEERRQRLSVHMDEIMNGNITAAMEIFDNLRKQEELQSILSRVEEIEKDTCELDVRSLRGVFENVSSNPNKHKRVKEENREERMPMMRDNDESKSSMAHVFGDLERASEEIMALKEQTLARLVDIEEAIKKALFSVSTLKADSDITSLSCLFKESLGTVQESPSSANISKISIGSSTTKPVQKSPAVQENTALPGSQTTKQQTSPPSSPAFISIQSASRQMDKTEVLPVGTNVCTTCQHGLKTEETFRTTKMLTCNSLAQNTKQVPRKGGQKQCSYTPKRELSVLEVLTNHEGKSITGTKTVTENYERTDNFGNRFYSSKTSTVIQPETATSVGQAVVSPVTYQITTCPDVLLPINQKL